MYSVIAWWLVIIGGLNWGLVGLADLNLIAVIFGTSFFARLIYIIIGVGAAYLLYERYFMKKA